MLPEKFFLNYANLFFPKGYENRDKIICKYFKDEYGKCKFRLKKIDETRNYLLEEIKHNDLKSEKHEKCLGL